MPAKQIDSTTRFAQSDINQSIVLIRPKLAQPHLSRGKTTQFENAGNDRNHWSKSAQFRKTPAIHPGIFAAPHSLAAFGIHACPTQSPQLTERERRGGRPFGVACSSQRPFTHDLHTRAAKASLLPDESRPSKIGLTPQPPTTRRPDRQTHHGPSHLTSRAVTRSIWAVN